MKTTIKKINKDSTSFMVQEENEVDTCYIILEQDQWQIEIN